MRIYYINPFVGLLVSKPLISLHEGDRGYRLDGWCECGLGQQRNDGGGCASMRETSERMESLGTYVTE